MRVVGALAGALVVSAAPAAGPAPIAGAAAAAPTATTLDDVQAQQWYLEPMQVEQMWKAGTGEGVKVAVIDSGVNADTPSLKGQVLVDEVPEAVGHRPTDDYTGLGTTMAELIAGTGAGGGIQGLAPGARIVPYRVELDTMRAGAEEKRKTPDLSEALTAAADTDVKIINMSLSSRWLTGNEEAAVEYAASKGKLLIASVGNDGGKEGEIGYPARDPYVVGVTASDSSGTVSKTASYGDHVDLAAPGDKIPRWCDADFAAYCAGDPDTRPAAALVSGAAALIWSAHPDWTVNQVTRALIDTAGRSWDKDNPSKYLGYGLIRPRKVLEDAGYDAGAADVDPLAKENGGDLLAASGAEAGDDTPSDGGQDTADSSVSAASTAPPPNHYDPLWLSLSAAATVIGLATTVIALLQLRRGRTAWQR
ncbi:S8 family serine peptidase [Streptomyces sp. NPDC001595]